MRATPLAIVVVLALALTPAHVFAAEESYRYIVATGTPSTRGFVDCGLRVTANGGEGIPLPGVTITVNGEPITIGGGSVGGPGGEIKPSHGGACFIPAAAGETLGVRVVDDAPGVQFFFQVFYSKPGPGSTDPEDLSNRDFADQVDRGTGAIVVTVPAGDWTEMHVVPDAGSVAGTVYVTR